MAAVKFSSTASATHVGGNPRKPNQDTFFTSPTALGVFDGHGIHGTRAAEIARDVIAAAGSFADAETAFKNELLKIPGAVASPDGDVKLWDASLSGGTTATHVTLSEGKLIVEHVGDSEVMVINRSSGAFTVLTKDHSTTSLTEYVRVLKEGKVTPNLFFDTAGGAFGYGVRPVFTLREPPPPEGECVWELNPKGGFYVNTVRRDWAAYVTLGNTSLNMFRSIGDFGLKKCGVSAVPDRVEWVLEEDTIVLAASDGLFDPLHYEEIRDCVVANGDKDAPGIAAAVLELGLAAGKKHFGSAHDNTTVCVGILESV
jgi:serine/threonine protein phosphatase PrpC